MSPIKRLIDKITGNDQPEQSQRIRAFGKLPSSREFQQLEAGQGIAKQFQDWLHQGHANWIRQRSVENRGKVASTCLLWPVPNSRKQAIIACIWSSRDSASRAFPFVLLVTMPIAPKTDLLQRFALCSQIGPLFSEQFKALFSGEKQLADLRESSVRELDAEELASVLAELKDQAHRINLQEWFNSLVAGYPGLDDSRFVGVLEQLMRRSQSSADAGLGIRLPLSRSFPFGPQICAWLNWLQRHLQVQTFHGVSLFAPQNGAVVHPAVAVLTRPITEADVQLATTDAAGIDSVDDAASAAIHLSAKPDKDTESPFQDDSLTLWDWSSQGANHQQAQA